jgi:hypothetical protein
MTFATIGTNGKIFRYLWQILPPERVYENCRRLYKPLTDKWLSNFPVWSIYGMNVAISNSAEKVHTPHQRPNCRQKGELPL